MITACILTRLDTRRQCSKLPTQGPLSGRLVAAAVSTDRVFDGNRWSHIVNFCSFPWSLTRKLCRSAQQTRTRIIEVEIKARTCFRKIWPLDKPSTDWSSAEFFYLHTHPNRTNRTVDTRWQRSKLSAQGPLSGRPLLFPKLIRRTLLTQPRWRQSKGNERYS